MVILAQFAVFAISWNHPAVTVHSLGKTTRHSEYSYYETDIYKKKWYLSWYTFPTMNNTFIFVNSKCFLVVTPSLQKRGGTLEGQILMGPFSQAVFVNLQFLWMMKLGVLYSRVPRQPWLISQFHSFRGEVCNLREVVRKTSIP